MIQTSAAPTTPTHARPYHGPACTTCRYHVQPAACCYPGSCPAPACEWCQLRPATTLALLGPGGCRQLQLCDDCAR